ncbi:MAG: glycerol-3-phosphate dehydrogenase [Clostridiales bacterium]|nr:glycerol-3-phosphate dehydrogenase [Clostridiales bacterium]
MKVSVLGCGRWGSFLAWYCSQIKSYDTYLWGRAGAVSLTQLEKNNGKNDYLQLPSSVTITSDLQLTIKDTDIIIISISAQHFREFLSSIDVTIFGDKPVILCMKGIECTTGKRLTQVAMECGILRQQVAVWVGPGHIQDLVHNNIPNCMVVDSYSEDLTRYLAKQLKSNLVRFYFGQDIIGTEIGAACKNIIGILAGMLDGAHLVSLKGPLMSRGAREVGRLIESLGGNSMSAYGLCHLGDYETTLFSQYSNNRKWGESYVLGHKFDKLAEGVDTTIAVYNIGKMLNIDLPLTYGLRDTLDNKYSPLDLIKNLFGRPDNKEFY